METKDAHLRYENYGNYRPIYLSVSKHTMFLGNCQSTSVLNF